MRQFEFPYNFDTNLIQFLHCLDPEGQTINCIYMPPFFQDYQTILRTGEQANLLDHMSREEYERHVHFINSLFPGKIQILLQKKEQFMPEDMIKYYLSLGIHKFCVGSAAQAKCIKNIDKTINIVGSISMQITRKEIEENLQEYSTCFDGFVLPFKASRNLQDIKKLPKNFYYILLVNAYCNIHCTGAHHWNYDYKDSKNIKCPGIYGFSNSISWQDAARIRPMDLGFFDPYIYIYKLQDRGWPTADIIRDYVLYSSDYSIYPDINYREEMYDGK